MRMHPDTDDAHNSTLYRCLTCSVTKLAAHRLCWTNTFFTAIAPGHNDMVATIWSQDVSTSPFSPHALPPIFPELLGPIAAQERL